jgi:3-oxoacyl-[acyl-carrier-protein] synthase II
VRIWMTGAGLVTSLGAGQKANWDRMLSGERGLSRVELFDVSEQRATLAGAIRDASSGRGGAFSRTSEFARLAAKEALHEAGIDPNACRVGLVVGTTTGGMFETEARLAKLHAEPHTREGERALVEMLSHPLSSVGDCLEGELGPFVRVRTVCSACSSGANALVIAALWLLEDAADCVVAGGTDGLCRLTLSGFNALAAVDPEPCRPFDRRRKGLNLGEGAGFVVLERANRALARGRAPLAELAGWSLGAEAHHITNPDATGKRAASLVMSALGRARLAAKDVDYVNAHGTGTPLNDPMEAKAILSALGGEAERVLVSSTKGHIGHTLGAAGAVEAVVAALAVKHQGVPATAGLEEPDPLCPLAHVMGKGRNARVRAAISNSFGFGGMDSVLVLTEPELGPPHGGEPTTASVPGSIVPARLAGGRSVVLTGAATISSFGVLGAHGSTELLKGPPRPVQKGALNLDLGALLDPGRARRLDRPARLGTVLAQRALAEAGIGSPGVVPSGKNDSVNVGLVLGSAFGSVDASAAFMHRVFEKGPRFASPGDFPNLVPSSPVGHASIYLGLSGPVLSVADLGTSGEGAVVQAHGLVAAGEAEALVAGAVEEASDIAERILARLFSRSEVGSVLPRSEGAGAVVVESEDHANSRGAPVRARLVASYEWHHGGVDPLSGVRGPRDSERSRVVLARESDDMAKILSSSPWRHVPRLSVGPRAGEHEALGGIAVAASVGLLGEGEVEEVLVVGLAKGRGYALLLAAP